MSDESNEKINEEKRVAKERFELAVDLRKFEIELFWKRSVFFWGFISAALVAYGLLRREGLVLPTALLSCFGLACSFAWTRINYGSKFWQENWESAAENEGTTIGYEDFWKAYPIQKKGKKRKFTAQKYSVSRLTTALSWFTTMLWAVLLLESACVAVYSSWGELLLVLLAAGVTIRFCYTDLYEECRSDPPMRPKEPKEKKT